MFMKMEGATIKDNGEVVGSVDANVSGGIVIHDEVRSETWFMGPMEIWVAYHEFRMTITDDQLKQPEEIQDASPPTNVDAHDSGEGVGN